MKGLLKLLAPFAPDPSGVVAALFEMGGLLVVLDAGGCTGNICGFDEPRWQTMKCALCSAGLRDMDAILGRDAQLLAKVEDCLTMLTVPFVALIGTPVPAVIGTDLKGLATLGAKRTKIPFFAFPTTGTRTYEYGAEEAFLTLTKHFLGQESRQKKSAQETPKTLAVLGATPLDLSMRTAAPLQQELLNEGNKEGFEKVVICGMGSSLAEMEALSKASKLLVVAPAGYKQAMYLSQTFAIPYSFGYPLGHLAPYLEKLANLPVATTRRILILHEQVLANSVRTWYRELNPSCEIVLGNWFSTIDALCEPQDLSLTHEAMFADLLQRGCFDAVVGDRVLARVWPDLTIPWIDLPHFAVSGRLLTL